MRLENKIALVTAAASGMGRAGVIRFAAEGAKIVAVDIDQKALDSVVKEITQAGHEAIGLCADLSDDQECTRIITQAVAQFGGIDLLWNHVGHPGFSKVEDIEPENYAITMDLNIRSVFMTTGAAIPQMRARGGGSILFTSSIAGLIGSPFSPLYSAAKWGVNGFHGISRGAPCSRQYSCQQRLSRRYRYPNDEDIYGSARSGNRWRGQPCDDEIDDSASACRQTRRSGEHCSVLAFR